MNAPASNTAPLERHEVMLRLERDHELPSDTIYLLHLAPLIEMLWADGKSQSAERALVHDYAMRLQRTWASEAGEDILSDQVIHLFLSRFLHRDDDIATLKSLRQLLLALHARPQPQAVLSLETVLDYCMDIAACAVTHYPYGPHERVNTAEKTLLRELVQQLAALPLPTRT